MADFVKNKKAPGNHHRRPSNKPKDYGSKKETVLPHPEVCAGTIEYQMSRTMAEEIIKGSKSKRPPQEILCNYVNTQCGLKGYCVKVLVDIN